MARASPFVVSVVEKIKNFTSCARAVRRADAISNYKLASSSNLVVTA